MVFALFLFAMLRWSYSSLTGEHVGLRVGAGLSSAPGASWHDRLLLQSNHLQGRCWSSAIASPQWSLRGNHARSRLSLPRQAPLLWQLPATHKLVNGNGDRCCTVSHAWNGPNDSGPV